MENNQILTNTIYTNTDVNIVREQGLDKFYTIPSYSKKCIDTVFNLYDNWDLIIEPSAGNGSFLTQLPKEIKLLVRM